MFGLAVDNIDFLPKIVRVHVRLTGSRLNFAPVKNRKEHDVLRAASVIPVLGEHIRAYPP